jgi:tetratricopeptide (TPR) repeat protein
VTDDNLYLEYSIPRHMLEPVKSVNVLALQDYRTPVTRILAAGQADPELLAETARFRLAHETALRLYFDEPLPGGPQDRIGLAELAYSQAPDELLTRTVYSRVVNDDAVDALLAGERARAVELFRKAVGIGDPVERALALNNLGAIHYEDGDLDRAREAWEACVVQEPNFSIAAYNLALLVAREKDYPRAIDLLRRSLVYDPQNATALNNLAYYLALSGEDLEEAEARARSAVDLEPSPITKDTLGYVLLRRDRWSEAADVLHSVVKEDPNAMESWLHLGMARAGEGRPDEARAAFEIVIRESNDEDLSRRAQDEMNRL